MKFKIVTLFTSFFLISNSFTQDFGRPELGVEGFASAGTNGGAYSLGLKFGFKTNENVIIGPSFRSLKSWSSNIEGGNFSFSVYGIGGFAHIRYGNTVFAGVEYELFKTPVNSLGIVMAEKSHASTLFLGGGFSREFKNFVRLNAGVFYDIINQQNSPFRPTYMMKKTNPQTGQIAGYIPVIYRITFFFPLGKIKKKGNEKNEEEEEE